MHYRVSYYLPGVDFASNFLVDRVELDGDFHPLQHVQGAPGNIRVLSSAFSDMVSSSFYFDPFLSGGGILEIEWLSSLGLWTPIYTQISGSVIGFGSEFGKLVVVYLSLGVYLAEVHDGRQ